jgi:hypothetical protein
MSVSLKFSEASSKLEHVRKPESIKERRRRNVYGEMLFTNVVMPFYNI